MKILSCFTALALVSCLVTAAPEKKKDNKQEESFLSAIHERNLERKMKKLEDYYAQYGAADNSLSRLLFVNLALTAKALKQHEKVIEFGQKALDFDNVSLTNQLNLNLAVASALLATKKDPEAAFAFAAKVIEIVRPMTVSTQMKSSYLVQACMIQVLAMDRKADSMEAQQKAMKAAMELYRLDPAEKYLSTVIIIANRLVKMGALDEVIGIVEPLYGQSASANLAKWLGVWYDKKGERPKAVEFLKASYESKPNAKVAYDLGILLQATDLDAAIDFLAESFLLADPVYSAKAEELLKHLYFNVKAKDKKPEEQELEYNSILDNARTKLELAENGGATTSQEPSR